MKIKEQDEQHMVLGGSFGNKTVIDKLTQNITMYRGFLFFHRKRVIPFSAVTNIEVNRQVRKRDLNKWDMYASGSNWRWEVTWYLSLDDVGKIIKYPLKPFPPLCSP